MSAHALKRNASARKESARPRLRRNASVKLTAGAKSASVWPSKRGSAIVAALMPIVALTTVKINVRALLGAPANSFLSLEGPY